MRAGRYPREQSGHAFHPAAETPQLRYASLAGRIASSLDRPDKRMRLAREFFALAETPEVRALAQLHLKTLMQAVRLDPFERAFRLALARCRRSLGMAGEAVTELRSAEQSGFALDDEERLELGRALLESGNVEEARNCFSAVNAGGFRAQAEIDLIECELRSAQTTDDWRKVLKALTELKFSQDGGHDGHAAELWCEKCLKFAVECDDHGLADELIGMLKTRFGSLESSRDPACNLLMAITQADGHGPSPSGTLHNLLLAHRMTKEMPVCGNDDERFKSLQNWRRLIAAEGSRWFGLKEAYLHALDGWALEAYRNKHFELARSLWSEVECVTPANPQVLKNLAIASTCMADDSGSAWYWERLTRAWNFYSELVPEADAYTAALQQKSHAFAEGAERKLPTLRRPEEYLDLAEILAKEALAFIVLGQISLRNPLLRCGVLAEDYSNQAERDEFLAEGHKSASRGLQLVAEWQRLGSHSELARCRQARLDEALTIARAKGPGKFAGYKQEQEAFRMHRKAAVRYYTTLLLLLQQLAELDLSNTEIRRKMAAIAACVTSFPHRIIKPLVLQAVNNLTEETDLQQFTEKMALGPWLASAMRLVQSGEAGEAVAILEEALSATPGSALARFVLAQCHAAGKKYSEAYDALVEAWQVCSDKTLQPEIEKFGADMDFRRVDEALARAKACLEKDDPEGAVSECRALHPKFGDHPYLLYMLARAHAANLDFAEARAGLEKARAARPIFENKELTEANDAFIEQIEGSAHLMILAKAVPLMQEERWSDAARVLAKGRSLDPNNPQVTYYEAMCLAHLDQVQQAERRAREAIEQCRSLLASQRTANTGKKSAPSNKGGKIKEPDIDETKPLLDAIDAFLPQIPVVVIQRELNSAQEAISEKRWYGALGDLAEALAKRPNAVPALFLKALCHYHLEEWDSAEAAAQKALPLCGAQDDALRQQLKLILEQVPMARIEKDMQAINKCLKRKRWKAALESIDKVLHAQPGIEICLFYRALCYFQLEQWDEAEDAADRALRTATRKEIRDQLQIIKTRASRQKQAARVSDIILAIERSDFPWGLTLALEKLRTSPHDAELKFLSAVCLFRSIMEQINSRQMIPTQEMFDPVEHSLDEARQWTADSDLIKQIDALANNVGTVRRQLRDRGIY